MAFAITRLLFITTYIENLQISDMEYIQKDPGIFLKQNSIMKSGEKHSKGKPGKLLAACRNQLGTAISAKESVTKQWLERYSNFCIHLYMLLFATVNNCIHMMNIHRNLQKGILSNYLPFRGSVNFCLLTDSLKFDQRCPNFNMQLNLN